jgi:AcrR family transcriptional regulator
MSAGVKPSSVHGRQAARIARTEAAILDAAQQLFLAQGYVPTTLAHVAERAGIATRTVFVRFGSKVALFRRVIDRALAGDDRPVGVTGRPPAQNALAAPTLAQRIDALADLTAGIMHRAGALFEVAAQAEGLEPELAAAWQAGRRATADLAAQFWRRAKADGLVPEHADLKQLAVSTDLLICADTMVHLRRTRRWTVRAYRTWLTAGLQALAAHTEPA